MTSVQQAIIDAANSYGVDSSIALAVAQRESGLNPNVHDGAAGEIGIFQLMPATAAQLGVDPRDPAQNIQGGVQYLARLFAMFDGDEKEALAAYNWGQGNVQNYPDPSQWPQSVQAYVDGVLSQASVYDGGVSPGSSVVAAGASSPAPAVGFSFSSLLPTTWLGFAGWGVGALLLITAVFGDGD